MHIQINSTSRLWAARILIGLVLFINVQCALAFFIDPHQFAPAYELTGIPGQAAIRGFAILFLMWNVPYAVALIHPVRYRVSLYETLVMQSLGLVGETFIFWSLPTEYALLRTSLLRFILFDGGGLVVLIIAAVITKTSEVCPASEV